MKKIIALIAVSLLSGCVSNTSRGPCIGVVDKAKPGVNYGLSYWNLAMAFVFSETLIVPAVVILKDLECPNAD